MKNSSRLLIFLAVLLLSALACQSLTGTPEPSPLPPTSPPATSTPFPTPHPTITAVPPTPTPITLPDEPVTGGTANPDEPVFVTGEIPYTSPFFVNSLVEPLVLLEDQAGFVNRDRDFVFSFASQAIGHVEVLPDDSLRYSLALPAVPQGTFVDVDNNGEADTGVQVFAVAYWSNTWGGPFLEERDGGGWSTASASTRSDPDRHGEIDGGVMLVWASDSEQGFPTGFGEDNLLFTEDDPTAPIPAGYNLVNLDEEPFRVYKEAQPSLVLYEGAGAVNDFSELSYGEAFEAMFAKVSIEYPFTEEKEIDWDALHDEFAPRFASATQFSAYYEALKDFTYRIPDTHVGMSFDSDYFFERYGGSFGLLLAELSDGRVIVTQVLPDEAGDLAGIEVGAEIVEWDSKPIAQALDETVSFFGPYSTAHHERQDQLIFVTRFPPDTNVDVAFQNPGASVHRATMVANIEYDSLFASIPGFSIDDLALPLQGEILEEYNLGYIQITTFSDDYNLMARLWERYMETLIENDVPGLIIDVRINGGGSGGMARDFAGYFFSDEFEMGRRSYYNDLLGEFEYLDRYSTISPGPLHYDGDVIVLVSSHCVSACEGFAYAMQYDGRATILGHTGTAGAFGEVGQGQYDMPDDVTMQFPTGRPETPSGDLLIENVGIIPNEFVPVTEASALGEVDAVLQAAITALAE